jgi:hypothetical protein
MFRDVAEAIIKSPKWKYALRNHTVEQNGKETTPFRKLIQRMPGIGCLDLDILRILLVYFI